MTVSHVLFYQINELSLPVSLVIDYTLILEQVVDLALCCVAVHLGSQIERKGEWSDTEQLTTPQNLLQLTVD